MSVPEAFVLVNPAASGGRAAARYDALRGDLARRFRLSETRIGDDWVAALRGAQARGVSVYLAAGGDGTVHALLNALVAPHDGRMPAGAVLGALGLGSSNDFHKPPRWHLGGVPACIAVERARPHDVVRVRHALGTGSQDEAYFVASASIGIAAAGNAYFNRGDALLAALKRRSSELAIAYTTLRVLVSFRSVAAELVLPYETRRCALFNLSVTKRANVTGGLRYEGVTPEDSGLVDVFLAADLGPLRRARTLVRASAGRFLGVPGTHHWAVRALSVRTERPVDLELDGEVVRADRAEFEVIEKGALLCG